MPRKGTRGSGRKAGKGASYSSTGMAPSNRADMRVKPLTASIPGSVPKTVTNRLAWDSVKVVQNITLSTSALVETNFSASLSLHPQVSSWTALFDQWCIPQFSVTFESQYPSGASFAPCQFYTALDFDNSTALGSISAIDDYSTSSNIVMGVNTKFTRSIRPCLKVAGTAGTGQSVGRFWVDSAVPSTPWFGIRSIAANVSTTYNIQAFYTIWFAFRNQI